MTSRTKAQIAAYQTEQDRIASLCAVGVCSSWRHEQGQYFAEVYRIDDYAVLHVTPWFDNRYDAIESSRDWCNRNSCWIACVDR